MNSPRRQGHGDVLKGHDSFSGIKPFKELGHDHAQMSEVTESHNGVNGEY
jgi:hypothetical protein